MHKLVFTDDDLGKKRYELAYQSIARTTKQVPTADWSDVIDLTKKLKSIGNPASKEKDALYDLQDGGAEILLEKGEYKQLLDFVKQPIWRPVFLEDVDELKVWLESIKHDPGSLKPDARPEKRKAGAAEIAGSIKPAEV